MSSIAGVPTREDAVQMCTSLIADLKKKSEEPKGEAEGGAAGGRSVHLSTLCSCLLT